MAAPRRVVAIEEHCIFPELKAALDEVPSRLQENVEGPEALLLDFEDQRLPAMDTRGIDVQVVSHRTPGAQIPDPEQAVAAARRANDDLAAAIGRHPTRFAGFATLPIAAPEAAGRELTRGVEELGLKGALIHGRVGGEFLDHPELDPILRAAADLDVPLYLHTGEPNEVIRNEYYDHLAIPADVKPTVEMIFSNSAWGWHFETGTHALRLILAGVFDRYPNLQVILGHWGEFVPYFLQRFNRSTGYFATHLKRKAADYFADNVYVTPSGLEHIPQLLFCLSVVGADRIMYAADYPYMKTTTGRAWIEGAPISEADKAKIAYRNAERLLRLG